jgi:uncharacterized GH25 family protein
LTHTRARICLAALAVFAFATLARIGPVAAHEYWLAPSNYRPGPGDTVAVRVFVGTGFRGESKPYTPRRTVRFTYEAGRAVDLTAVGVNGETVWARIVPTDRGGALLAYESNSTYIELPAAEFDRYLALEGLAGPLAARAKKGAQAGAGRELYRRSCKAWLAGTDPARATRVVRLPLEIVPLADPSRGPALEVRVLYEGKPLASALLRAWRQPLGPGNAPVSAAARDSVGPAAEARTDAQGVARLALEGAGEWILSTVHMVPATNPADADWQSTWASLTFARAGTEPAR